MSAAAQQSCKSASDAALSYGLKGRLYLSGSGWLLLSVPNALGRGAFAALNEAGAELPAKPDADYNAHISVMRPEELARIGGPEAVTERGKEFGYTLGPVRSVQPAGWNDVSRCWFIEVHSPELERLRKSYGLSSLPNDDKFRFHVTFAVLRKGVLTRDPERRKVAAADDWEGVPELVRDRYATAIQIRATLPAVDAAAWHPETGILFVQGGKTAQVNWPPCVTSVCEGPPPGAQVDWVQVKQAALPGWVRAPYQLAGRLTGGPSPLSNAIVNSLLGAGLGYGVGTAAEHLFPERYLERGRLRKTLAIAGLVPGALYGLSQTGASRTALRQAPLAGALGHTGAGDALRGVGQSVTAAPLTGSWWQALTTPTEKLPVSPIQTEWADYQRKNGGVREVFVKTAFQTGLSGSQGVPFYPVPVDAFNRAIWADTAANPYGRPYTSPQVAAAASGLVTGVQQLYNAPSTLSPQHFISGLAAAGVDLATAHVAGRILGALGGLSPEGQQTLQRAGIWSGLIRGVTQSVLGI